MILEILRWWLVLELIGLVALPLTLTVFRRLPERGYAFAKPVGILLVSYLAWLGAMLGLAGFSVSTLIGAALVVGALGALAVARARIRPLALLRANLPAIIFHEALFALMLYLGLVLRWRGIYGAQINHTETPMDFALLNGVLASADFPPQDPWLANYPINYYYFGYVMIAALTRLSQLPSARTFNLAGATIYALAATGVAGIVWNLVGLDRAARAGPAASAGARRPGFVAPALASAVAVILVLVAGNQVAALQWLTRSQSVVALRGVELVQALGQAGGSGPITLREPLPPMPGTEEWSGLQTLPVAESRRAAVSSWWPSRAVWDQLRGPDGQVYRTYTITEFPFFSFLLGDLHPHVLSLPWSLLAVALALNLLTRQAAPEWLRGTVGRIELFLTAVTLGGLYAINSWDLPTYALLFLGALLLLYLRLAGEPRQVFWAHLIQQAGLLVVVSWAVWLPFHMTFVSLVGGQGLPIGLSPARTALTQFVVVFGLFAVPLVALLVDAARRRIAGKYPEGLLALVAGAGLIVVGIVLGFPLLWTLPLALWALHFAYRSAANPARAFALWTVALGALVIFGTEIIYLRDVFEGQMPRMNTLFKFYYQVWLLWGMLTGFALYVLLRRPRPIAALWGVPFAVLLLGAFVYPTLTPARGAVDRTLDGTDYIQRERPSDAAGIAWIRANVPGDAIVLEAPSQYSYRPEWSRVSMATGRPTLIGWRGHEGQWRGGQPEVRDRLDEIFGDATTIFTTIDTGQAGALIDKHGVDYVYVGPTEQTFIGENGAPPEALTKFGEFMDVAWSGDGVTIYRKR